MSLFAGSKWGDVGKGVARQTEKYDVRFVGEEDVAQHAHLLWRHTHAPHPTSKPNDIGEVGWSLPELNQVGLCRSIYSVAERNSHQCTDLSQVLGCWRGFLRAKYFLLK